MKSGGSKSKGSEFEREIAKSLSLWISEGETKDLLWRTALSGGRFSTGKSIVGAGDLGSLGTSELSKQFTDAMCVECKNYREVSITKAFFNEKSDLRIWWNQVKTESKKAGLIPMMITKGNRQPILLVLPVGLKGFITVNIQFVIVSSMGVVIYKYEDFIRSVKWLDLFNIITKPPLRLIRKAQ